MLNKPVRRDVPSPIGSDNARFGPFRRHEPSANSPTPMPKPDRAVSSTRRLHSPSPGTRSRRRGPPHESFLRTETAPLDAPSPSTGYRNNRPFSHRILVIAVSNSLTRSATLLRRMAATPRRPILRREGSDPVASAICSSGCNDPNPRARRTRSCIALTSIAHVPRDPEGPSTYSDLPGRLLKTLQPCPPKDGGHHAGTRSRHPGDNGADSRISIL